MTEDTQPHLEFSRAEHQAMNRVTAQETAPGMPRPDTAWMVRRDQSRAQRMSHPRALQALKDFAAEIGVCIRPITLRRTDLVTGETALIDRPCGATRESKCPACARKAKRLRQVQCREGWHRTDEPVVPAVANDEQVAAIRLRADFEYLRAEALANGRWEHVADLDEGIEEVEKVIAASGLRGPITPPRAGGSDGEGGDPPRRKRSTRRRQDTPNLPRRKVVARTIGRTFTGKAGRVFQPSTFLTYTLPSYGRVREDGSPVDPSSYDYRRAAWDAVHFPALLDRLWQNLRRAEGWNVQYFGAVEPQRRLAPHAHFAVRGAIPRATIRLVARATYHQVWWPSTAVIRYPEHAPQPVWDEHAPIYDQETGAVKSVGSFLDPSTGEPLLTWDEALDRLDQELDADPGREPEHVVRLGPQLDVQGVLGGTPQADKMIGYMTKYLTKSVSECHAPETAGAVEHQRRLWQELRVTPCSPRCPNWLRYGIQPKGARAKMAPGFCRAKVHQLDTLGLGGRRVLVSRDWSGKTLKDHRWDQAAWVRKVLAVSLGHEAPMTDELVAQIEAARVGAGPPPAEAWQIANPRDPDVPDLARRLMRAISTRRQYRDQLAAARVAQQASDEQGDVSATGGDPARPG